MEQYEFRGSVYVGLGGFCILLFRIIKIIDEYDNNESKSAVNKNETTDNKDNEDDIEMKGDNTNNSKSKYQVSQWKILTDKLCKICVSKDVNELKQYLLKCILRYNNAMLNDLESGRKQRYSFLEGIPGAYGIRVVYYYYMNDDIKINKYLTKLKQLSDNVEKLDSCELLYGRCGYVSTFLFIHHYLSKDKDNLKILECDEVIKVCKSIIESGKIYAEMYNNLNQTNFLKKNDIPLMWQWHESQYFGGAHGVAGIINILCSIPLIMKKYKDLLCKMMNCCYDAFTFQSGNYASSIRGYFKQRDTLVQFCHGPTGFVPMYTNAVRKLKLMVNQDDNDENLSNKYMKYAYNAQDVIWKRGLLRKGPGLCHGIGGNGYVFLSCYKICGELKYLYRAFKFVQVIVDKNTKYPKKPDRPDSLFEGKAGGVIFVLDTLFAPETAGFPCYEF